MDASDVTPQDASDRSARSLAGELQSVRAELSALRAELSQVRQVATGAWAPGTRVDSVDDSWGSQRIVLPPGAPSRGFRVHVRWDSELEAALAEIEPGLVFYTCPKAGGMDELVFGAPHSLSFLLDNPPSSVTLGVVLARKVFPNHSAKYFEHLTAPSYLELFSTARLLFPPADYVTFVQPIAMVSLRLESGRLIAAVKQFYEGTWSVREEVAPGTLMLWTQSSVPAGWRLIEFGAEDAMLRVFPHTPIDSSLTPSAPSPIVFGRTYVMTSEGSSENLTPVLSSPDQIGHDQLVQALRHLSVCLIQKL